MVLPAGWQVGAVAHAALGAEIDRRHAQLGTARVVGRYLEGLRPAATAADAERGAAPLSPLTTRQKAARVAFYFITMAAIMAIGTGLGVGIAAIVVLTGGTALPAGIALAIGAGAGAGGFAGLGAIAMLKTSKQEFIDQSNAFARLF